MVLSTKLKQSLRIGTKLVRYNLFKKRCPLFINLLLTNRCNLACFYCYPQVFNRKVEEISTEKWLDIIDKFHEMGTEVISLHGGEPTLHPGIGEIIERVKKHEMICEVVTNGYYIEKNKTALKKVDSLGISIDGTKDENDKNRGDGSFQKALEALEFAKSSGLTIRIKAVITKNNISSLDYLCNLAKEHQVHLNVTLPSIHTDDEDLLPTTEQTIEFWEKVKDYKLKGYPIAYALSSIDYMLKWPFERNKWVDSSECDDLEPKTVVPCVRNDLSCYVDADGMIYPCGVLWDTYPGKNLLDVGIEEAWNNIKKKECYTCDFVGEVEINQLFTLSASTILETTKYYLKNIGLPKNILKPAAQTKGSISDNKSFSR